MERGVTFAIHPDAQSVTASLFQKAIGEVIRLVIDVDYAVTRERNPRRWIIGSLSTSVPTITLIPILHEVNTVDAIIAGVRRVASGEATDPPEFFTEQALDDLRTMHRLFRGRDRAKRLVFSANGSGEAIVDSGIAEKVQKILAGGYWNLGSVEGSLDAINLHGRPTLTLWDRVSGAPVRCSFPGDPNWKAKVKGLLEKRVVVRGKVHYFRNGIPRSISDVEDLIDATPRADLPQAFFGCVPDREAASDPAGFLRRARGGG